MNAGVLLKWRGCWCWLLLALAVFIPDLAWSASLPQIDVQPVGLTNGPGADTSFTVVASGPGTLTYQWLFNGTNLVDDGHFFGSTSSLLTVSNIAYPDAGLYQAIVSNSHGSITSSVVTLGVQRVMAWGNDTWGACDVPLSVSNAVMVSGGDMHGVALKADGTVAAWGDNSLGWGETNIPVGLSNVVSVHAIAGGTYALKADGTVVGWGTYAIPPPAGLSNVLEIAAADGRDKALALRADDSLVEWNSSGFTNGDIPPGLSNVVSIAGGATHLLALKADGTVVAWGENSFGQTNVPADLNQVVAITAGYYNSLALKANGDLVGWGSDTHNLSSGATNIHNAVAISSGHSHSLALINDGTVAAWGYDYVGETEVPPGISNALSVAAGNDFSLAMRGGHSVPFIFQNPIKVQVIAGKSAIFKVGAGGQVPLRYQWRFSNTNLPGATADRLLLTNVQPSQVGIYYVAVSNALSAAYSSGAMLTTIPLSITGQPQNQTVIAGSNVTFTVTADSAAPLNYQWWLNTSPLPGQTNQSLVLNNVQAGAAGTYFVLVSNVYGSVASSVAILNIHFPSVITTQPQSQTRVQGDTASFYVEATGDQTLYFSFYSAGSSSPLAGKGGGTNWGFNFPNVQPGQAGTYFYTISNAYGYAVSSNAVLTVLVPVTFGTQPQSQTNIVGGSIVLTATANGSDPKAYQWFREGVPLIDDARISGATSSSLTLTDLQTNDAAGYWLVASNAANSATSAVASVTVLVPPSFTLQPGDQTTEAGSNIVFTAAADGSQPINYQWYLNSSPLSDNTRVSGSQTASLSISNVLTSDAGTYSVVAVNLGSATPSSNAMLTVLVPPGVATQPLGRSSPLGLSTTFTATGSGTGPLTYQWRLNGADISDATNSSYTIPAIGTNDLGIYQFVVSNIVGVAVSSNALLTIGPVAAWGYNYYNECTVPPGLSNVTSMAAAKYYSLASLAADGLEVWGSALGYTNSGFTNVIAVSASENGALGLRSDGTVTGSGSVNPLSYKAFPSNEVQVAAGYYSGLALRAEGTVETWGSYTPTAYLPIVVPPSLTKVTAIAAGYQHSMALRSDGTVVAWGYGPATNVPIGLSNVVAIAAGSVHSLALKSDGTVVAWGSGAGTNIPEGLSNVMAIATSSYYDQRSSAGFAIQSNGTVVVWGTLPFNLTNTPAGLSNVVSLAIGSLHALALVNDGSPQILREPAGGTAWSGSDWTLRAKAVGTAPLHYQWQFNGTNLEGATNANLLLPAIQSASAGNYQLMVSNAFGVVASLPVPLTVMDSAPFFLTQPPTNDYVYFGSKIDLSTVVAGSGPILYQWQFNGQDIPGANSDTLSFGRVHMSDMGRYTLIASNSFEVITSAVVNLNVQQLVTWGGNVGGATNIPSGLTNITAISANYYGNIALRADGTVAIWGDSGYVATNTAAGISNVVEVSAGYNTYLVLKSDGHPYLWGSGVYSVYSNAVVNQANVVAIEAANGSCALLHSDGTVAWVTPNGAFNEAGLSNAIAVEPFDNGFFALRADGTVYSHPGGYTAPSSWTNVLSLASGRYSGLMVDRNGKLKEWPQSFFSTGTSNVIAVAAASGSNLGSKFLMGSDGSVTAGYPGPATNVPYGLAKVLRLDAGTTHCLALLSDHDFPPALLHTALDTTQFVVSSKGGPQWFGQTAVSHDGVSAAQSATIGNNTASSMRMWIQGPITISFWWKVSSTVGHGFLSFSAGGNVLTNISGEVDWQQCTLNLPAGNQILQWTYSKDGDPASGQDAGWVDQLQLIPQPPIIVSQPVDQSVVGPTNVTLSVGVSGTPPLACSWSKDGNPFIAPNSPSLLILNAVRTNSGVYGLVVTNAAGTVTSSNATLLVRVPQLLASPVLLPDGSIQFSSSDLGGGMPSADELADFEVQASTNLVDWATLPGSLSVSNGMFLLQDAAATNCPARYYRMVEH